jgi:nucleotide-binding universal stress UspA family protein
MAIVSTTAVTFERILVLTDFSEVSERALGYARAIAKQDNSQLLLVHVTSPLNLITPPEGAWIDETALEQGQEEAQRQQFGAALRSEGYQARTISRTGPLYEEILSAVDDNLPDVIVMGSHGRTSHDRLLVGSDAEAILRRTRCPVLPVGPQARPIQEQAWRLNEIMCATTLDPRSAHVAAFAHNLAAQHGAELLLFHVQLPQQADPDWEAFEDAFHHYAPEGTGEHSWLRSRITSASPGTSIVDFAKQSGSDLIVMGAHPASALATHFGPGTAAKVMIGAPCPVMTLLEA